MPLPLEGIRVVDCTIWQNGPQATVMLADMGAEVIKVEEPQYGDPGRGINRPGFQPGALNAYFEAHDRHKKSITVNLRSEEGKEIVYRLVKNADVFVQNFRIGVAERLGLDFATLTRHNPRLIYASNSGLGRKGPESAKPVFDMIGQARSGIMAVNADENGTPRWFPGIGLADQVGAMWLAYGISMALIARERYGIAQAVDVSQLGSQIALQAHSLNGYLFFGRTVPPFNRLEVRNPLWNSYQARDGKWFVLGCLQSDRYWASLCKVIGRPDLQDDPRFASAVAREQNARDLIAILDTAFSERPRSEWLQLLEAEDIICGPVNDYADVAEDPQVIANEYITTIEHPNHGTVRITGCPVHLSATPPNACGYAPELGQHTEEILLTLGYGWEDIGRLREDGVI